METDYDVKLLGVVEDTLIEKGLLEAVSGESVSGILRVDDIDELAFCSDIHTDRRQNKELIFVKFEEFLSKRKGADDPSSSSASASSSSSASSLPRVGLIIAGDVSQDMRVLEKTLRRARELFPRAVWFVPGNNELRLDQELVRSGAGDSFLKFRQVLLLCRRLGVLVSPTEVYSSPSSRSPLALVAPLFAWHSPRFDPNWIPRLPNSGAFRRGWLDFRTTAFPGAASDHCHDLAPMVFSALTLRSLQPLFSSSSKLRPQSECEVESEAITCDGKIPTQREDPDNEQEPQRKYPLVVTYSHFLPRPELLPWLALWRRPDLLHVTGCRLLLEPLELLRGCAERMIHVYGHTHINASHRLDGIRYFQNALGHPSERHDGILSRIAGVGIGSSSSWRLRSIHLQTGALS